MIRCLGPVRCRQRGPGWPQHLLPALAAPHMPRCDWRMPAEAVAECLKIIKPGSGRDLLCRECLEWHFRDLLARYIEPADADRAVNAQDKKNFMAMAAAMECAVEHMERSWPLGRWSPENANSLSSVGAQEQWALVVRYLRFQSAMTCHAAALLKNKRGHPRNTFKHNCAQSAYELLDEFNPNHPTLTDGGSFIQLAGVLYEAVTGQPETGDGLLRQCRNVLRTYRRDPPRRPAHG
jgi:hypothetical protein